MPLKLSLKPGEAVIVNGAVLRNGDRRGSVLLENQARVLREKDVMRPTDLETLGQRVYFAVMQMYLTGLIEGTPYDQVASSLAEILASNPSEDIKALVLDISAACAAGETYRALSCSRKLIKAERFNAQEASHG